MLDYFVAFQLEGLLNYRLFPLHQGLEKLCKAYLLAKNSKEWANIESEEERATWIESFVREKPAHDLWVLVKRVADSLPQVAAWVAGSRQSSFLDLLTMAYEESRYPKPISQSIWDKHGFPALVSHRNEEQAYALGSAILSGIEDQFGIRHPLDKPIDSGIESEDWQRFLNIWNLRGSKK